MNKTNLKASLFLASLLSLGLIVVSETLLYKILSPFSQTLASFLLQFRFFSLILCYFLYKLSQQFITRSEQEVCNWKKTISVSTLFLILTFFVVFILKAWVPKVEMWTEIIPFLFTGVLAEEFLFRGCIYNLIKEAKPKIFFGPFTYAVFFSSLLFGIQHLSYHSFSLTQNSLTQVAYTFLGGLFCATVRESSGKLWPAILLHIAVNSIALLLSF